MIKNRVLLLTVYSNNMRLLDNFSQLLHTNLSFTCIKHANVCNCRYRLGGTHHWRWQAVLSVIHFLPHRGSSFTEGRCVVKDIYTVNNKQQSNADYHSAPEKVSLYLALLVNTELGCVLCFNEYLYGTCSWSGSRSRPHFWYIPLCML